MRTEKNFKHSREQAWKQRRVTYFLARAVGQVVVSLVYPGFAQRLHEIHERSVQAGVGIFFQQEADGSVYVKTIVSNGSAERDGVAQVHISLHVLDSTCN